MQHVFDSASLPLFVMKHSCVVSCSQIDLLELCNPPVFDNNSVNISVVLIGWY